MKKYEMWNIVCMIRWNQSGSFLFMKEVVLSTWTVSNRGALLMIYPVEGSYSYEASLAL